MAIDNTGKIAYIYQDGTWYAISGAVNTAGAYTWTGTQNFANTVTFESVVKAEGGINNFQNYTARDTAIPVPTNGVVVFVRQDNAGNVINQLQYYKNGSWVSINDVVIDAKTSNYSLQTFDSGKLITVSSSSDVVISVPANSAQPFPVGTTIDIARMGSGDVTITPASGAIIYSKGDYLDIAYQYGIVKLTKLDTNSWLLTGDLIVQGVPTTTTTTTAAPTTTTTAATTGATTTTTSGGGGTTTTTTTTEATTTTTQQTSGGTPPQTTTTTEPTTASPTYTYFCTTKENTGDSYSFTNETDASGCVSGVANTICVYAPVGSNSYPAAPAYPCSVTTTTTTTTTTTGATTTTTTASPTTTTTTGASTTTTTTCSGNYVYSQNGTSSNWGCASGTANVIYWYDECNNVVDEIFVSCVPGSTTTTTAAPTTTTTAAPVTTTTTAAPVTTTTTAAPVTTTTTAAPVTTTTTAAPTTTASSGCTTPEPIPGECFCMNGSWAC